MLCYNGWGICGKIKEELSEIDTEDQPKGVLITFFWFCAI
jgi:hypothetical protein